MYVAAGLLCFAVYVLPVPPETYKPGFAAIGVRNARVRGHRPVRGPQAPRLGSHGVALLGVPLVSVAIWNSAEGHGGPAADIEVLYFWPALYAAHFLRRRGQVADRGP